MTARRKRQEAGPLQALWTPRFRYRGGLLYWLLVGLPLLIVCFMWTAVIVTAWLFWLLGVAVRAGVEAYQRRRRSH
jgi:hypothetical protein